MIYIEIIVSRLVLTCRLSFSSHLLPNNIFSTSADAFSSILRIQFLMFSNDFSCVMSYTNIMPIAPR